MKNSSLTEKEMLYIQDAMDHEELCILKYNQYAQMTTCPQLQQLMQQLSAAEVRHMQTLQGFQSGQGTSMSSFGQGMSMGGQSGQQNSSTSNQYGQGMSMGGQSGQQNSSMSNQSGQGMSMGGQSGQQSSSMSNQSGQSMSMGGQSSQRSSTSGQSGQQGMSMSSQSGQGTTSSGQSSQSYGQSSRSSQSGKSSQNSQNSQSGRSSGQSNQYGQSSQGTSFDEEMMLRDLLTTEKATTDLYSHAVLESTNAQLRQAFTHIQQEEQQHAYQLFQYAQNKGWYTPQ